MSEIVERTTAAGPPASRAPDSADHGAAEDRHGSTSAVDGTEGDAARLPDVPPDDALRGALAAEHARLRATFRSGRTRPLAWRTAQLEALLRLLEEGEADLLGALHEDLRRPPLEGYGADVGTTKAEVRHLLRHLPRWVKPRRVLSGMAALPGHGRIIPEPLGVGLIIAPWNYPVQLVLQPLAAALAAGNCALLKPSELAPATSSVLARLVPRYLDPEAVTVVEGAVPETTALLELPFDHIFFTGSTSVGRIVMAAAARHLTPVVLELGGKTPTVVAADADLDVAAHRIVWGKHLNAGQTCIAPDYVLVEDQVRDELVDRMIGVVREFLGDAPAASPDFARIVNARHFDRLSGLLASSGATVVSTAEPDPATRFFPPTILVEPDPEAPVMQEEIFGPLLPVLSVPSVAEAVAFVNDRPKPLALYVFSQSTETVDRVLEQTSSGGACVNQTLLHITASNLPFGGVGPSGMGQYHGKAGFDAYTHHKGVLVRPTKPELPLMYPPYSRIKDRLFRRVM